jgi:glycosyltransferase involved in cell wall biosynthesis
MDAGNLKILGLTHGDPFNRHSFSGSNYGLFTELEKREVLFSAHDIDIYGIRKKLLALPQFSMNREKWGQKYNASETVFKARSDNATCICKKCKEDINCIIQIGAMFSPSTSDIPVTSYHDGNIALAFRGGGHSVVNQLQKTTYNQLVERERTIYIKNDAIFTFSDYVKQSIIKDFGINEDKIHVVYGGSNIEVPNLTKHELDNKYHNKNILFVAVDFARKGGSTVIEAFKIVKREVPEATLTIVGSSPDIKEDGVNVSGFINKNTLTGEKQLAQYFTNASVYVLPSLYEAFGVSYIEAMHFRTPCIGSNIAAIPELITDGETGFVIKPEDYITLADKIIQILRSPQLIRDMGDSGYAKAQEKFTWERVAGKMMAVMQKLI